MNIFLKSTIIEQVAENLAVPHVVISRENGNNRPLSCVLLRPVGTDRIVNKLEFVWREGCDF